VRRWSSDFWRARLREYDLGVAGYSGTPLPRKLGIKPGMDVGLGDPPPGFIATLGPLPPEVSMRTSMRGSLDVIVAFFVRRSALERRMAVMMRAMRPATGLWIAWPKRASGVATDITENTVREIGLGAGLVDNKVCAIDETWSGLRLVIRLKDRP
jgi:hypothetical protein